MTLSQPTPNGKSAREKEQAAEDQIARISRLADDLTQQIDGQYEVMDSLCWAEASRLSGIAFEIVQALNRNDLETAHRIACGNDVDGTTLGVAV